MKSARYNSTVMRWTNAILIGLFVALLWLPMLDTFFHFDHTPALNENRSLAEFPQIAYAIGNLKQYIANLEAYFNDHFGCRKQLIRWHAESRYALFHSGGEPNVIIGKDGWLFYAVKQMVEHYQGVQQFTPQGLLDWQTLLERRRDWLARHGIKYIFVIAPDKQTIYPEYLPDWLTKMRDSKLDQLTAYMHVHSTVEFLDLRPALLDANRIKPTYLKNDSHWNDFGGFVAYHEIAKVLSRQFPGLKPLSVDSFEQGQVIKFEGDLAQCIGVNITENNDFFLTPKSNLPTLEMTINLVEHPAFKGVAFTRNFKAEGNMVVFHDSFGRDFELFLGYHFNKVTYVWENSLDSALIEQEKPTVVISEIAEREFNVVDPKELMKQEVLK